MFSKLLLSLSLVISVLSMAIAAESGVRQLYSFESEAEVKDILKDSENVDIIPVLDAGVTKGKLCARIVLKGGKGWSYFTLGKEAIKNWSKYDYFAMDVYTNETERHQLHFELWDKLTKGYHTRCGLDVAKTHQGKQTIIIKINRAKRNGKEGRDWSEAEPQDKIQMDAMTKVKIFYKQSPRDITLWVDNMRLLTEEAAFPKFEINAPKGSLAFDFNLKGASGKGLTQVSAADKYSVRKDYGFLGDAKLHARGGKGWPDPLSGSYVKADNNASMKFKAKVPNGTYNVLVLGGRVYDTSIKDYRYLLKINDKSIIDETLTKDQFNSEDHLYRFMRTQFSIKEHAMWYNYIDRMYANYTETVEVTDGTLTLDAHNVFLSALVVVPAANKAEFDALTKKVQADRITFFEKSYYTPKRDYSVPESGDSTVFIPKLAERPMPWTRAKDPAKKAKLDLASAKGQFVCMRVAITPHKDLGQTRISPSDLKGPGTIAAKDMKWFFSNYRSTGEYIGEAALIPAPGLNLEKGITTTAYITVRVPIDAKAGNYTGAVKIDYEKAPSVSVPVSLEIYPFVLEQVLPVSYGMYYAPGWFDDKTLKEQFDWMREIGFTAVSVGAPRVTGVNIKNKKVSLRFNKKLYDMVKDAGLGAHPEQKIMATSLGVGRSIARHLPGSKGAIVDQQPGIELKQPAFKELWFDAMKQYKDFIDNSGLPIAVEVIDEPREVPNPWNRNLADTITYAKMLKEVGMTRFITPMTDGSGGLDYRPLVDNTDIISIHAWKASAKILTKAQEDKVKIWFYNTGKDRYSWGFYNWRMDSKGRWEWHFRWRTGNHFGEYPGGEWHNPFTKTDALSTPAPAKYPGAHVFKSQYFDIADGITDYAYLYTLEQQIAKAKDNASKAKAVSEAEKFLEALRSAMPIFPKVKGLEGASSGALLGQGLEGEAKKNTDIWRAKLVEHILAVSK